MDWYLIDIPRIEMLELMAKQEQMQPVWRPRSVISRGVLALARRFWKSTLATRAELGKSSEI